MALASGGKEASDEAHTVAIGNRLVNDVFQTLRHHSEGIGWSAPTQARN